MKTEKIVRKSRTREETRHAYSLAIVQVKTWILKHPTQHPAGALKGLQVDHNFVALLKQSDVISHKDRRWSWIAGPETAMEDIVETVRKASAARRAYYENMRKDAREMPMPAESKNQEHPKQFEFVLPPPTDLQIAERLRRIETFINVMYFHLQTSGIIREKPFQQEQTATVG